MNQLHARNHDATLLEGLFQLVISGDTRSDEFQQLEASVYERLLSTYDRDEVGIGSAPVSRSMTA